MALKTAEGTAKLYTEFLRGAFRSSWIARFGYLMARHSLQKVRSRTDPRRYNGAILLGLNGIVVKSHGGTDPIGFANAIGVAVDMAAQRLQRDDPRRTGAPGTRRIGAAGQGGGNLTMLHRPALLRSQVIGCGAYLPSRIVTNKELAQRIDTTDEWITTRTGIKQRHIAAEGELTSDLALNAARRALDSAGIEAKEVDADRPRHDDAGPDFSGDGRRASRRGWASPAASPSTCRPCAAASSTRSPSPIIS